MVNLHNHYIPYLMVVSLRVKRGKHYKLLLKWVP